LVNQEIVVVEDEGITAMHLRAMLGSWGYNVPATADNAEDALDRIAATQPDLVLMDIRLKGLMDGVTAADLIHGRFEIPVVFLSAHNDEATLQRVKASRAYGFVVKPFGEREVFIAVKTALFRHRIDKALADSREWNNAPLSEVGHPVVATDPGGRIMYMNQAAELLTGWTEMDAFERDATKVLLCVSASGDPLDEHPILRVVRDGETAVTEPDSVLISRDGSERPIGCRIAQIRDSSDDLIGLIVSLRPRREQRDHEDRPNHQTQHDPLTGLANRALLMDCLGDAVARAQHHNSLVAVQLLNLDRFKGVNQSLGPAVGDQLLGAVAARVQNCVRRTDLLARTGEDGFAVIQHDLENMGGAAILAEKLVTIFSDPFVIEGIEIKVTASVGVAVYPLDGEHPEPLVRKAEEAVNRAKAAGRNQHQFSGGNVEGLIASQKSLERDLRLAMERDQLEVQYQPIFDLGSREITGAEALLRWRHPGAGMLPAAKFIPLADRCGLLTPITDWVLRQALESAGTWQATTPGLRVSVNIAGSQLRRRDLVPAVIHALRDTSLDARHLELEIREDLLIRQPPINANLNMQRLRQLGICLTLDNYGFAYASMMSLKKLPLSRLKIDRSLVSGVTRDQGIQAIVKATIDLAQSSGLEVVANGIETEEQLRWLRFHGCDHGQGNHLGPPLPGTDFLNR